MTTEERCNVYLEYKKNLSRVQVLEDEIAAATRAGDEVFAKATDREEGYKLADEAGWLLADDLADAKRKAEAEAAACYKVLLDNSYDLSDHYSCCAYGVRDIKQVKVVLLDDTVLHGVIYPYVYDNAQEMYLEREDGNADLGEGWEVKDIFHEDK